MKIFHIKNEHVKSILIAVIFVAAMVTILFSLDKVPGDLPSSTLVGGLVFGLGAILFPKHIHNYDRWIRGRDEKTPDKRTLHKIRLFGIGIIILAILIEIYL